MVSASALNIPTTIFGLVPWPHIPGIAGSPDKQVLEAIFMTVHSGLAAALLALVALHVAAVLKHRFVLKDDVAARMLPRRHRPS